MSQKAEPDAVAQFGANQWLVDELYEQYLTDKHAVDPAWWEFFEDYRPESGAPTNGSGRTERPAGGAPGTGTRAEVAAPSTGNGPG
ncbi:2-oxoglutarate dehydrogenase E1 subunit family protein, partial [Cellulomonas bogoriensis]|uniref:2-oxoglutarate dehydrogenase E1 subunit family protein n=1 Tax=Cellulomonas bogoriensis TaxID=301388 RepID=UPI000558567E